MAVDYRLVEANSRLAGYTARLIAAKLLRVEDYDPDDPLDFAMPICGEDGKPWAYCEDGRIIRLFAVREAQCF